MRSAGSAEEFLENAPSWSKELGQLREILLSTELDETIKWGTLVYCRNGRNIVGINGFKNYFGLWFFQGALLKDPRQRLMNAQEGRTKAQRQWRFQSAKEIDRKLILSYVKEAIALADDGKEIKPDRDKPIEIPSELELALRKNTKARQSFEAMSKSCRREYAEYISEAKKPETRQRRLKKIMPMIEAGGRFNS